MVVVRGISVVVASAVLFAAGGGLIAACLNWVAPGYYRGVFPHADRHGHAAEVGVGTGILQGLMLGLLVGGVVALGLAWFNQLPWADCARAVAVVCACAGAFGLGGGLVGLGLRVLVPGYYRGVFRGGGQPDFSPADVGLGLGASPGAVLGAIVGGLTVVGLAWRRSRARTMASGRLGASPGPTRLG